MKVLFATAEFAPVASVGGLAAAAAGLVQELRRRGTAIDVVMPDYGTVELADQTTFELTDVPAWVSPARVRSGVHPVAGPLHLVEVPGMARAHPYLQPDGSGWPDNDARFLGFSMAVAALVRRWTPDVVHLNDWHTAAALADIDPDVASVLSIHNLAYQGATVAEWLGRLGPRSASYERYGTCNPLSGGLLLADAIVAVSPSYAAEILEPANGYGLHEVLEHRGDALVGILNGIDTDMWDPSSDPLLAATYTAKNLKPRAVNQAAVRKAMGLPAGPGPLFVMVTRLVEQKGVDLVLPLVDFLRGMPAQLAVLGSGEAALASALHRAAADHPAHVAFVEGYDEALSHRLFAGGDLLLMPSRFEPCGLAQMQALRYGCLPVVTAVGGLRDTVIDGDERPNEGTGWAAPHPDTLALLDVAHRAVRGWSVPNRRAAAQARGMAVDWSWREPATRHLALYEQVRGR